MKPNLHSPLDRPLRIATRGSKLALWQANHVAQLLSQQGYTTELVILKTTGDIVQDRFLFEIGGKGLFVKELEEALISRGADLAVHSLKDVPARLAAPFCLAAVLPRDAATDVMVFREERALATELDEHAFAALGPLTIGTASLRRQALLRHAMPSVRTEAIRGNVDTRLRKLMDGAWDALVLAEASLDRLALTQYHYSRLAPSWFVPCPAQGALAVEAVAESEGAKAAACLDHALTRLHVTTERAILAALGGDCTMPFGCFVRALPRSGFAEAEAVLVGKNGAMARARHEGPLAAAGTQHGFANALLAKLFAQDVATLLQSLGLKPLTLAEAVARLDF